MVRGFIILGITYFVLTACRSAGEPSETPEFFLPPTIATTPIPSETPTTTPAPPTPTPTCEDNLVFLDDLTIPDGTIVSPGKPLDKRWLIQNAGTCNWDEGYRIKLIAGEAMGAAIEQALFPARSGTEIELRIQFTAPEELGLASSAWQAFNPAGEEFGDPIFIEIFVEEITPTPDSTADPIG
jgi:hypothetical protein